MAGTRGARPPSLPILILRIHTVLSDICGRGCSALLYPLGPFYHFHAHAQYGCNPNSQKLQLFVGGAASGCQNPLCLQARESQKSLITPQQ